jgi:hypothetical protein
VQLGVPVRADVPPRPGHRVGPARRGRPADPPHR